MDLHRSVLCIFGEERDVDRNDAVIERPSAIVSRPEKVQPRPHQPTSPKSNVTEISRQKYDVLELGSRLCSLRPLQTT